MASDEDDDYMSNDFIRKLEQEDVRPGLEFSSKTARKNAMEKRKNDCDLGSSTSKKSKSSAEISFKQSLATPLDKSNVGFSLLAKMGYKQGSGLGKAGEGRTEPVPLNVKLDRTGLGTEALKREQRSKAEKILNDVRSKRVKAMAMQREQFRHEKMSQFYDKRMAGVFANSQKICHNLDSEKGLLEPIEVYFWPKSEMDDSDEPATEKVDGLEDQSCNEDYLRIERSAQSETCHFFTAEELRKNLKNLEQYLRETYLYCIWCCAKYQDADDLELCPGMGPQAHGETS